MTAVIITSYNNLELLKRAINSVFMQVTTFKFRVIISDDGSTDGTPEYLNNLKVPKHIKNYVLLNKHRGMVQNFAAALDMCKHTDFIAFCDADDYWTDPNKLQYQVDYMHSHPEVILSFTRVMVYNQYRNVFESFIPQCELTYDNLLIGGYIPNCTTIIRTKYYLKYANIHKYIKYRDWAYAIWLELAYRGTIGYQERETAVYVIYKESISHSITRRKRLQWVTGLWLIKARMIREHGCKPLTLAKVIIGAVRDVYSIIFKRWI